MKGLRTMSCYVAFPILVKLLQGRLVFFILLAGSLVYDTMISADEIVIARVGR